MKGRASSVINRIAPINKLLHTQTAKEVETDELKLVLEKNKPYLGNYYYVFVIQYRTGARISEVLNINLSNINARGQMFIIGLKGGQNRLIECYEARDYIIKCKRVHKEPFEYLNRFTAYRLLQNIGIGKVKKGNSVASVTHLFRDEYVKSVRSIAIDKEDISRSIGHKSTKSTEFYGKD